MPFDDLIASAHRSEQQQRFQELQRVGQWQADLSRRPAWPRRALQTFRRWLRHGTTERSAPPAPPPNPTLPDV